MYIYIFIIIIDIYIYMIYTGVSQNRGTTFQHWVPFWKVPTNSLHDNSVCFPETTIISIISPVHVTRTYVSSHWTHMSSVQTPVLSLYNWLVDGEIPLRMDCEHASHIQKKHTYTHIPIYNYIYIIFINHHHHHDIYIYISLSLSPS